MLPIYNRLGRASTLVFSSVICLAVAVPYSPPSQPSLGSQTSLASHTSLPSPTPQMALTQLTPLMPATFRPSADATRGDNVFGIVRIAEAQTQRVPIVENPASPSNAPTLHLSQNPVTEVGGLNADERYEILLISDADLLSDLSLVVAPTIGPHTGQSVEIRIFDTNGKFVRRFGREGDGPGEYRTVSRIYVLPGDSIAVVDGTARRVLLMDPMGTQLGSKSYTGTPYCCFADGSFVTAASTFSLPSTQRNSLGRPLLPLLLNTLRPPDAEPRAIGTIAWGDSSLRIGPVPVIAREQTFMLVQNPAWPFGRSASLVVTDSSIVYGIGDSYEYQVSRPDGSPLRTVRYAVPPTPVTDAMIATAREKILSRSMTPAARVEYEAVLSRLKYPTTTPAFNSVVAEHDGSVWTEAYDIAGPTHRWTKFDPSGRVVGTLQLPAQLVLVKFTRGHVIVRRENASDGTSSVLVYRIESTR